LHDMSLLLQIAFQAHTTTPEYEITRCSVIVLG
jgi:hypothetical protein